MCLVCTMRTDLQKPPIRDEPILPFLMHLPFWQFLFQPIMLSILLKDYLCNSDILHIIYVTRPTKTGHIRICTNYKHLENGTFLVTVHNKHVL